MSTATGSEMVDIDVRARNDVDDCCITGSGVLSKNRVIIADCNNRAIKLVDIRTYRLLNEFYVSSPPFDIAVINKNRTAVSIPDMQKILLLITVNDILTEEWMIGVQGKCRGLAYKNNKLFVTFDNIPRLEILDLNGNVIRIIEKDHEGRNFFTLPYYVCVNIDTDTIYVSDICRDTVTGFTDSGRLTSVYRNQELRGPGKVCTDGQGNVYVCGFWSRNVHMITPKCTLVKMILTKADGLHRNVYSVSYCQKSKRLFIGMCNNNSINIYQLS